MLEFNKYNDFIILREFLLRGPVLSCYTKQVEDQKLSCLDKIINALYQNAWEILDAC
jgi:hypothetical protein